MRHAQILLSLLVILFLVSCTKTPDGLLNDNTDQIYKADLRRERPCWSCMYADASGAATGAYFGAWGGPIGIAVGAAVFGAWGSIIEDHSCDCPRIITQYDFIEFVDVTDYDPDGSNDYDFVGRAHNQILNEFRYNEMDVDSLEAYYDLAMGIIMEMDEIENSTFIPTQAFHDSVMVGLSNWPLTPNIPGYMNLINNLDEEFFKDTAILTNLATLVSNYSGDSIALPIIATAYHTYNYWKFYEGEEPE